MVCKHLNFLHVKNFVFKNDKRENFTKAFIFCVYYFIVPSFIVLQFYFIYFITGGYCVAFLVWLLLVVFSVLGGQKLLVGRCPCKRTFPSSDVVHRWTIEAGVNKYWEAIEHQLCLP